MDREDLGDWFWCDDELDKGAVLFGVRALEALMFNGCVVVDFGETGA